MSDHSLLTLVLIDDCSEDRVIFSHFLQQDSLYTYRIVEMETITEAMEWCQQEIPDIILLDYLLPDGDGLEFLELLRGQLGNEQSAVIMLTGQGDEIIAVRAMKRGAQEYLIKNTLTPEILQGAIRHAVEEMHLIKQLQQSQEQQQLMASIALRIRQTLQLQEILTATAREVRQFLQADRVLVYQFHPDMSGTVVAESVLPGWKISLGREIQDTCFQQGAGADYHQGKKRAIDNIYQADLSDCHLELLEEFEVKANLIVPILVNNQLWGLLIAQQCTAPRHWQTVELDLLEQLGVQIAIAIQQASAYEQLQAEIAERQRVEESLRESEERFRSTFEQAAVGISHVSLNGQFIRLNQRFCEITDYSQAELQTLTFQEITHPEDLAGDLEQVQKLLAGEIDTYSIEKRYHRKNGEFVWINLTVSLVRDRSGQPKYFISVIQDITDRKQVEAALLQKKERLNMALEAAAMGTWDWNIQTGEITWSPSLEILFGLTPGSFNGHFETVVAMMHPDDRQRILQAINCAVYERQEYNIEFRFIKPDGTVRWALGKGRVFYDQKGQPIQMMGVDLDITERKQAEAHIRESEERFREMADTAPVLIWMSGIDKLCYYFNKTWLDFTGKTLEQERGHGWAEGVHPDDFQDCLHTYVNAFDARQNFQMEYRLQRFDGEYRWILDTGIPRFTHEGDFLGYIGSCIDITERRLAEQALQQLNQELETRVEQRTQALKESEERWQLALRGTNDGIWDWNLKTNQVFYSTRWKEMRGFAEDEISSNLEECLSRIHPDDYQRVMQAINDHFAQKAPFFQAEYRVERKNGSYIWVLDRGQALWDEAGNVIRMTGSETDINRRKQAEAELLAITTLQQAILDGTDYAIMSTRPDGIIQTFNAAAQNMLGYKAEEVVGQVTPIIFYDLEELQQEAEALSRELGRKITLGEEFAEAKIQQGNSDEEYTFIRKDGSRFPVSLSVKPLYSPEGQMMGGVGIAKDITQQKQIETQLRKTAASLTAAQRIANLGSWEFDLQTQEITWSEEVFRIFRRNLATDAPTYAELRQLIHPDDRDPHDVVVQQASQQGNSYEIECRFYRQDESLGYFLARGEVIFDADGKPIHLIGTIQDITNRKQAEEKLRNLSDRLTLALKAGAIGIWDWDIIHEAQWDDRMYELYDMQKSDSLATYQSWLNSLHPEDRVAAEAAFEAAVRGEKEFDTEFRIIHRDGSIHFIKAAAIIQRNQQGEAQRMVGINYDITERKDTEAQLRQTNEQLSQTNAELARVTRLKDEFLANMSHELRTPLNAILGMSEGLKEGVFGDINERQKKAITTIERSGKHLLELINDILDLSKIESGKVELHLSDVSVKSVCHASLAFVRQMALKKNIRLTTQIFDHLSRIQVDERRLRQVLINLLSNAIKFTPEAGSVSLEVQLEQPPDPIIHPPLSPSSPSPLLTLSVTDTGIGICAEDLKKLFQPFVQVDSSLNRQYQGTGLGLALVQRIVALHEGTVSVSSEPGKGSCFTIRIPYRTSDNFPKTEETPILPSHCLPKENAQVLLIEDSLPAAEQISRYLQEMGMQPIVYPRGEGAAAEVERLLPALVILDLQLPNLSGWEILHQIKTNPHTQKIPVLIISVIDERTTGLAQGAFEYLVKPITRHQLQTTLKKLQHPQCSDFEQQSLLPKPNEKSPLILLAEDNPANIDTMSGYLECRGYRLVLANNGQQAIDIALAQRPDLIVIDIQMPVMDGLEAIRCIREDRLLVHVPIIALTALAMAGDRETCLTAGANEYLSKPVKLKQLVATIQQLLQR